MKMYASGDKGKQEESSKIELVSDFNTMTYDGPFKKVFAIKRILAIVIKETIGLYRSEERRVGKECRL